MQILENYFSFRVHHLSKKMGSEISSMCESTFNLSRKEVRILYLLHTRNLNQLTDIFSATNTDKARISRITNKLENSGYIVKSRVASDQRKQNIEITRKGVLVVEGFLKELKTYNEKVLSIFDDEEKQILMKMLSRMESAH